MYDNSQTAEQNLERVKRVRKAMKPKPFVTTKRKCTKKRSGERTVCPDLIECGCFGTMTFGCPNHLGEFLNQDDYGEPLRSNMCKQLNPDGIREGQFLTRKKKR